MPDPSAKQNSDTHVSVPHVHCCVFRTVPSLFTQGGVHVQVEVSPISIQYIPAIMSHVVAPHLHVDTSFNTVPLLLEHCVVIIFLQSYVVDAAQ